MRKPFVLCTTLLLTCVAHAWSGGLERQAPDTRFLFQEGKYLEVSWMNVSPDLNGSGGLLDPAALGTGDILDRYDNFRFAYKADHNDCISYGLTIDQPLGVDTNYPIRATSGYSGTTAKVDSVALSGILSFRLSPNWSGYIGGRAQTVNAATTIPFTTSLGLGGPYRAVADRDSGFGYLAGIAYHREEIALRVAATYYSEIDHMHDTTETVGAVVTTSQTPITTPQAFSLEFQSGVAEDTLVLGSLRWVDWSSFEIAPVVFQTGLGVPLVGYTDDWVMYTLGVGRKINEQWSIAVILSYEPDTDQVLTTLGPVDGRFIYGIAPSYTMGNMKVTVGVNFIELGSALNFATTRFEDGEGIAVGVRVGWQL